MSSYNTNGDNVRGTLEEVVGTVTVIDETNSSFCIDGLRPSVAVHPENAEELSSALYAAHENDLAIAPFGGQTRLELGNTPTRIDIAVDLTRLDHIVEHTPADLTATVQAGITIEKLQNTLGQHGQFLAIDTPLVERATIGGVLAVGASGPTKWQYGSPRDTVIGMTVTQADGTITKSGGQVVKNVSGYDMARLHVGALGTLGIISEVSFKLTPLPDDEATVVAVNDDLRSCINTGLAIFQSDVIPLAITSFDTVANDQMNSVDSSGSGFLAIRLGGRPLALERQIKECQSLCHQFGSSQISVIRGDEARGFWRRVTNFGWDESNKPLILCRALVEPTGITDAIEAARRLQGLESLILSVVAQPAHGVVLLAWSRDVKAPSKDAPARFIQKVRETIQHIGGRMIIERCPVNLKPRFDIWPEVGPQLVTMRRLKEQFDRKNILNPGRYAGGI